MDDDVIPERFEPPESFKANALIKDLSVHEAAAVDPVGWWREQARALHWFTEPEGGLDDENPPF
jgi:acetyl-CoA synthetase